MSEVFNRAIGLAKEVFDDASESPLTVMRKLGLNVPKPEDLSKSTITVTETHQKILSNDLYNDTDNSGIDVWLQGAIDGKINNSWKRFRNEWTQKLMDDSSFTDTIPSNQTDFVNLVTARSDYKNRKKRDDESAKG